MQHTLANSVTRTGVGLHSGATVTATLHPAPVGAGRSFVRTDLPDRSEIPATIAAVSRTQLSTVLASGEATVGTVEHLLATLVALGIDNARIDLDGPEVPLLDGSARDWIGAIAEAGTRQQDAPAPPAIAAREPVWASQGEAFVVALPAARPRLSAAIDFPAAAIGRQQHTWHPDLDFASEIAPARTFALAEQIEPARRAGLIRGGSLENALVCAGDTWLNPPLRFANEPARHKLLDLVGDLSLLGQLPRARIFAYKASHALHVQLARALSATAAIAHC